MHELTVEIVPQRVKQDTSCKVRVNGEILLIEVNVERRKLPVVGWREARKGDTLNSNGDSAFTNYFTLYRTLAKHFIVNVLSANSIPNHIDFGRSADDSRASIPWIGSAG